MENQQNKVKCKIQKLTIFPGNKITPRWKLDMVAVRTTNGNFIACLYQLPHFTKLLQEGKEITLTTSPCYYKPKYLMVK
jgi:hypothetical protein